MMEVYLGFDGGGSKTTCAICTQNGELLALGTAGPSNPHTTAHTKIQAHIADCYQQALQKLAAATEETITIRAACLGIAGFAGESGRAVISDCCKQSAVPFPTQHTAVISDAEIALHAAHGNQAGLLLIAGTGAICVGRGTDGRWLRAGGWGRIADDQGSGYWIGRQALRVALKQFDERSPASPFMAAIFNALGVTAPTELSPLRYEPQLASLTPLVIKLSEEGDNTARHILAEAVDHLCQLLMACNRQADQAVERYSVTGGVLENSPNLLAQVKARLRESAIGLHYVDLSMPPVIAALQLAEQARPSQVANFGSNLLRAV